MSPRRKSWIGPTRHAAVVDFYPAEHSGLVDQRVVCRALMFMLADALMKFSRLFWPGCWRVGRL